MKIMPLEVTLNFVFLISHPS